MLAESKRTLESALPDSVSAIDKARTHAGLELKNHVPTILPTITAWDTNFAVLRVSADGEFDLKTVFDFAGVEPWYIWQSETSFRHRQYRVTEYNGRWFEFTEQYADLTSPSTGERVPCHVAVIFPTWADGIIGEIAFAEPAWGDRVLTEQEAKDVSGHLQTYEDAWRSGDLDARLATVSDKTCSIIRIVEANGDRRHRAVAHSKRELRDAWAADAEGRVLEVQLVHQVMTRWYALVVYDALIQLSDCTVERQTVRLHPLGPDQKFIGELTYSMEIRA